VNLIPGFDSHHATDGYPGGVFGSFWRQGTDAVGMFNQVAGVARPCAPRLDAGHKGFD
jgi:hypothetical protein